MGQAYSLLKGVLTVKLLCLIILWCQVSEVLDLAGFLSV